MWIHRANWLRKGAGNTRWLCGGDDGREGDEPISGTMIAGRQRFEAADGSGGNASGEIAHLMFE